MVITILRNVKGDEDLLSYEKFLYTLVESMKDDHKLYKNHKNLLELMKKYNNPFTTFLKSVNELIVKHKGWDLTHLFPRIEEHFKSDAYILSSFFGYMKGELSKKGVELAIVIAIVHVISHNNARGVKVKESVVEAVLKEANRYLKETGIKKELKLKVVRKKEPVEIYEWLRKRGR